MVAKLTNWLTKYRYNST